MTCRGQDFRIKTNDAMKAERVQLVWKSEAGKNDNEDGYLTCTDLLRQSYMSRR